MNGALKRAMAMGMGMLSANPVPAVPRPKPRRSIPKHWSPEQARHFLALHKGDRLSPVWSFLLGSGGKSRQAIRTIDLNLTGH